MSAVRRSRIILAALVALCAVTLAVPAADARLPHARPYRVGGPITLDTDLVSESGASAWAIDAFLAASTHLPPLGAAFRAAERSYGVNARFLLAAALHESGWGTSYLSRVKHNLFGYNAYDRDPGRYATAFATYAANIDATARFIKDWYLTPGGRWWAGQPTLRGMQQSWSSSKAWGISVSRVANGIRLATFAGGSVAFTAPKVSGTLHDGEAASIDLGWAGPPLPAGVVFTTTWEPVEEDAAAGGASPAGAGPGGASPGGASPAGASPELEASASPAPSSAASAPAIGGAQGAPATTIARRVSSGPRSVTIAAPAPAAPGSFLLRVAMQDVGGAPLPDAERADIPTVAVRVWGDRGVAYDLDPSVDGRGAVIRITDTGRLAIPALQVERAASALVPDVTVSRSIVTVTASGTGPDDPDILLVAEPLDADLPPGGVLTIDVPAIAAATGRPTNWLSVTLTVLGDPTWLAPATSAGAWFTDPGSRPVGPPSPPAPSPVSPPSPTPSPSPTPTPAPTPTPTPAAAHGTTTYSEHAGAIVYRGSWGDAPYSGYVGGDATWSKTPGSTATFTFTGSSVSWIGPVGPTRGLALVSLDGVAVARVSLWRPSFTARAVIFQRAFGSSGRHTLTIQVLTMPSHPTVAIDAFVVGF